MEYRLLLKELETKHEAMGKTAAAIGISEETLRSKLTGRLPLTAFDVNMICLANNITSYSDKIKFFYPFHPKNGISKRRTEGLHRYGK